MGENEQGGMLRTVIVVGLIALIAVVATALVIGLKSDMKSKTETTSDVVATASHKDLFADFTPANISWQGSMFRIPVIGEIPPNNWREVHLKITPLNSDLKANTDVNVYLTPTGKDEPGNDWDDKSQREIVYRNAKSNEVVSNSNVATLKEGVTYSILIKYVNHSKKTFYDPSDDWLRSSIRLEKVSGTGSASIRVDEIKAATYPDSNG